MNKLARRSENFSSGSVAGPQGLYRDELLGSTQAKTVCKLFSNLRQVNRGEFIGEDAHRGLEGSRVLIDRAHGHGTWELYRLDQDLYLVAADGVYDTPRVEAVPGEGLVEFHLRLAGVLEMTLPGRSEPLIATGPSLLMLYQPEGVDASERILPKSRDAGVSLFCRPEFLAHLLRRNSIAHWPVLEEIEAHRGGRVVWHRLLPLSAGLLYVAKSLLQNPFQHGIRLLHAEAKALEILCEVLSTADTGVMAHAPAASDAEVRQLEIARRLLCTQLSSPPRIEDIARTVGMSQSKLKRTFKSRYGVTLFAFGLEYRMRHALHLLRARRMTVEQVAQSVGYQHQTSFSAAFREHFGFRPRSARTEIH
jgi:AraC-like DNA-binding protein